ncbi:hypothetical protein FFF34_006550 [Inquilinus sp. KBS0705]|nr:hypothetical protein FFF34_006550 [Inquilinus sp. KBS0705]
MKHTLQRSFLPVLILIVFVTSSCLKGTKVDNVVPVVVTSDVVIDAANKISWSGGTVTTAAAITTCGICYSSSNSNPTTADTKTADTITNYTYTSKITGITPGSTYYVRAYASTAGTTAYGETIKVVVPADISATYGTVSTLAGSSTEGFTDGSGPAALFNKPAGITTDAAGNIYIADSFNSAIRKATPAGIVTTYAGNGQVGYVDGSLTQAQFYAASSQVFDSNGNLFVADKGNNLIRKITPAGVVSTFAGNGSAGYANGTGTSASFNTPAAIAIDGSNNLYVADYGNNTIRKITSAGVVTAYAGSGVAGYINGDVSTAQFNKPNGIAVDAAGNVYVAEQANHAVRKITTDGIVTTYTGGAKNTKLLGSPSSLVIKSGVMYIADASGRILSVNASNILQVLAGKYATSGFVNGNGSVALFSNPQGIAVGNTGIIYVSDSNNNQIRKITL